MLLSPSHLKALVDESFFLSIKNHLALARAYQAASCFEASLACLRTALETWPNASEVHYLLAVAYHSNQDDSEAEKSCRVAIGLDHSSADAWNLLGAILENNAAESNEALACYRKAIECNPCCAPAWNNLGNHAWRSGEIDASIPCYRKVTEYDPSLFQGFYNYARALQQKGQIADALGLYAQAISLKADHVESYWNTAICHLLAGQYKEGWAHYDYRLRLPGQPVLHAQPDLPLWDGGSLAADQPLLLVSEQGFGDTIQFVRYVKDLVERGVTVRLCIQPQLHDLVIASGLHPNPIAPDETQGLADGFWLPLMSLPRLLGVEPRSSADQLPYLKPLKSHVQKWSRLLAAETRPIVAIHWQGNHWLEATNESFWGRSFPLELFSPLVAGDDVRLLSLQKGYGSEQRSACSFKDRFVDCQPLIDATWDFLETAAIIVNCDLVITSDSAVAHLAGALGKPAWLLLKQVPEWRWGLTGDSTFWYPTLRLFRQERDGDWADLMGRVASELQGFLRDRQGRRLPLAMAESQYGSEALVKVRRLRLRLRGLASPFWDWVARSGDSASASDASLSLSGVQPESRQIVGPTSSDDRLEDRCAAIDRLMAAGLLQEAELIAHHAIAGDGDCDPRSLQRFGLIQLKSGRFLRAAHALHLALRYGAESGQTLGYLAICWHQLGQHRRARGFYRAALRHGAATSDLFTNYGCLLHESGCVEEAVEAGRRALLLDDRHIQARFNLSAALLTLGQYSEGWDAYEARLVHPSISALLVRPDRPCWDGQSSLEGLVLLVVAEQGYGDSIQFIRYVRLLRSRCANVVICLPPALHRLFVGVDGCQTIYAPEQLSEACFDVWIPLLSLPRIFGVVPDDPVVTKPYLQVAADAALDWSRRLKSEKGPLVGLCWQGNPVAERGVLRGRSMPLEHFAPLTAVASVRLLSLQKIDGVDQLETCGFRSAFVPDQDAFSQVLDFSEMAAAMACCDLVITVDTSVAHLAGAMGLPTWLLLHKTPDWRWGLEGDSTFWYPSLRLFRQAEAGDWGDVIRRVVEALRAAVRDD